MSDGSFGSAFRVLHEAFPMAMPRTQRREVQKLLRKMVTGAITPEEAAEQSDLSPEIVALLRFLISKGLDAFGVIISLLAFLQAQAWHEEDQRERERDRNAQQEMYQLFRENLEQLHHDEQTLEARLRRVEEAQLVEAEEDPPRDQAHSRSRAPSETASSPKPRSPEPQPTRKKKKGKKRS